MNAFSWLNDLMTWLGKLFPRLVLIKSTEVGVLFSWKGNRRLVQPGLLLFWPVVQELQTTPTTLRTLELSSQLMGGETISIVIFWKITDALTALTTFHQLPSNLDDQGQAALSRTYADYGSEKTNDEICRGVKAELTAKLANFGYDIVDVGIVTRGETISLRHFKDWGTHEEL